MMMSPTAIFISYSHDSDQHRAKVLSLAERLQSDGYDVRLDQYVKGDPEEGWPRWTWNQLDAAEFVLVICSANYYRRFRGHEQPGKGKGADWEGALIIQEIYDSRSRAVRFLPVIFQHEHFCYIPEPLRGRTHYVLGSPDGYPSLCAVLNSAAKGESARGTKLTNNLPRRSSLDLRKPTPDFTGRRDQLERLRQAIAGGKRIVIIWGPPGVGKTELALALADAAATDFPGSAIMIDLRGTSSDPMSWREAMRRILHAINPGCRLPDDQEELAAEYRSRMRSGSGILLLENAGDVDGSDDAEIGPLIAPETWLRIITSRQHIVLPGAFPERLGTMTHAEARGMLMSVLSPTRKDLPQCGLDDVLEQCDYLPLAIRLAGKALLVRDDWSLEEYASRLRSKKPERMGEVMTEVMASIESSYELLDDNVAARFLELSVFSAPFDRPSAAAVWGVNDEEADRVLGELLKYSLVDWDDQAKRYKLLDSIHQFTTYTFSESCGTQLKELQVRLAKHMVRLLAEANEMYLKGGASVTAASRRFDANWPHIQNVYQWLRSHRSDLEAIRLINEIPASAPQLFDLLRPPRERIKWRRAALAAARKLGDRHREGHHLANLGLAFAELGKQRRAITLFKRRIEVARELGDLEYEARGLGNLGLAYAKLGQTQLAIKCQRTYLKIARTIGDRRGQGNALSNLALATESFDMAEAVTLHRQALDISLEIKDRRAEATFLGHLGRAHLNLGNMRDAIAYFERAIPIHGEIGARDDKARDCWHLAIALEKQGLLIRSRELIRECVRIEEELGHHERGHPEAQKHVRYLKVLERRVKESQSVQDHGSPACWVGRDTALARLADALHQVKQGEGVTIVVRGESGIGKTALANRFFEIFCGKPTTILLRGRCERTSTMYRGFQGLVGALAQHLVLQPKEVIHRIMPADIAPLVKIFPILEEVEEFAEACDSTYEMEQRERRQRAFYALRQLLCHLSRENLLVLFIDDAQWAGQDMGDLFAELFRAPDAPQCLTICTRRDKHADDTFFQTPPRERESSNGALRCTDLWLDPLSRSEANELAGSILGERAEMEVTDGIWNQTQGHPLFVRMLADDAQQRDRLDQIPDLEETILARANALSATQREVLELIAVVGCGIAEEALVEAAPTIDVPTALGELESRHFVSIVDAGDGRRTNIYHDKIRETIRDHLKIEQRSAYCQRLIPWLEEAGADSAVLAELYAGSGDHKRAGTYFWRAASTAQESLLFGEASNFYRLAISHLKPDDGQELELRRSLADSLRQGGNATDAAEQYLKAAEAESATDQDKLDLLSQRAHCLLTSGYVDQGEVALEQVLSECGIRFPRTSWVAIGSILWSQLWLKLRRFEQPPAQRALPDGERRELQAYWSAVAGFSVIDPLRAADFSARYLRKAMRYGDRTHLIRALSAYSGHVAAAGYQNRERVEDLLEHLRMLADANKTPYAQAVLAIARGVATHLQSRYRESVKLCRQAMAILASNESLRADRHCREAMWERNVAHSLEMWSLMYMGRIDELAERQPALVRAAENAKDHFATLNFGTQVMTYILLAADQPDEARCRLQMDADRLHPSRFFVQHQNHLLAQAFLEQYCHNGRKAWEHLQQARQLYTKSWLSRVQHMRIDFLQAEGRAAVAAAEGRDQELLLRAAEVAAKELEDQKTPWAAAHAKLLRANLVAAHNDSEAAGRFQDAAACFEMLDGQLFAAAARIRAAQLMATSCVDAKRLMSDLGVSQPERMANALVPGRFLPRPG